MNVRVDNVSRLAQLLGFPLVAYDLETTGLPQHGPVAITEYAGMVFLPSGAVLHYGSLINPEAPIQPDAARLTGISQDMVADKENWGQRFAGNIKQLIDVGAYFFGFNNASFDNKRLEEQGARYNVPCKIEKTFDVRRMHLTFVQKPLNSSGKLAQVAGYYGVTAQGSLHRATADTVMTVEILDVMIELFTIEAVVEYIKMINTADKNTASQMLTKKNLEMFFKRQPDATLQECAAYFSKPIEKCLFEISACIDERLIAGIGLRDEDMIQKLMPAIIEAPETVINEKKLKAWKEYFQLRALTPDYIQIRFALLDANLTWASLKPLKQQ